MNPETLSTLILLGSFLVMILLRFPIAYAVGISTVLVRTWFPCPSRWSRAFGPSP